MAVEELTTEDLDYLQRTGSEPPPLSDTASATIAPPALRRLLRVEAVGRLEKEATASQALRLVSEDLLIGLHSYNVPLAFVVGGERGRVGIRIGTWLEAGSSAASLEEGEQLLRAGLSALYPAIEVVSEEPVQREWSLGGLVLGMPTAKPPETLDGVLPLDRLFRALGGTGWSALVLAQPVEGAFVRDLRLGLLNEIRSAETATKSTGVPNPLSDTYVELLRVALKQFSDAQVTGAWRTSAYLLGDADSYYRLASVWRGVFSGDESAPEPLRVWDRPEVPRLASQWAMPVPESTDSPPGLYQRPFDHQTLLTSRQLAAYVHFPQLETNGFAIRTVPHFDAVPPPLPDAGVSVGTIVERGRETATEYRTGLGALTRHVFVTGVTGSGKTNTIFHLLKQASTTDIPFLVIEPAKTEYRALLDDPDLGARLQVFTLGNENVAPFRLNPFEVPEGVPVGLHLDLLRPVFNVSFGMWTPLPQVLEVCLYEIYSDRGWDVTTGVNRRLDDRSERAEAFPTLSELVGKVDEVVDRLGYEERIAGDIRAALHVRLNSLRTGGKGRMLDVQRSLPISVLLDCPTILELEGMGDDDDKAFAMALLMIRLVEHRRTEGEAQGQLRHLLVIEEAHRLLANVSGHREEGEADVRGKAVETFTNLLSEIRAYGQGIVIADQIPAKLAPDVIKNTNLKIAHRIVAADDRSVLAGAMAMTGRQEGSLATLTVGRAAVFADGDDAPLLVKVPKTKGGPGHASPAHQRVREQLDALGILNDLPQFNHPSFECDDACLRWVDACEVARRLADDDDVRRTLQRLLLSTLYDPEALERTWPQLELAAALRRPQWVAQPALLGRLCLHGAQSLASRAGSLAGWTYADTAEWASAAHNLLLSGLAHEGSVAAAEQVRTLSERLRGDRFGPFLGCERIWGEDDPSCLCHRPVAEVVASEAFSDAWEEATEADLDTGQGRKEIWGVCQDAAYHVVEFPEEEMAPDLFDHLALSARRVALCFGQQMLAARGWSHPKSQERAVAELLAEAGHQ